MTISLTNAQARYLLVLLSDTEIMSDEEDRLNEAIYNKINKKL